MVYSDIYLTDFWGTKDTKAYMTWRKIRGLLKNKEGIHRSDPVWGSEPCVKSTELRVTQTLDLNPDSIFSIMTLDVIYSKQQMLCICFLLLCLAYKKHGIFINRFTINFCMYHIAYLSNTRIYRIKKTNKVNYMIISEQGEHTMKR